MRYALWDTPRGRSRRNVFGSTEHEARLRIQYERDGYAGTDDGDPAGAEEQAEHVYFVQSALGADLAAAGTTRMRNAGGRNRTDRRLA